MTCTRCCGHLVHEYIHGGSGKWWWRCVSCGDRIDGLILRNRAEQDMMRAELADAQDRDVREWAALMAKIPA